MSTWHALFYPLKAGSEETVKELFRGSDRPQFDVRDAEGNVVGRLLGTMAFVGKEMAVRVIEVEGALPMVAAHMSRQPEVKEFERQLENHLTRPRDMMSPDGARQFFRDSALECVLTRRHDQPLEADALS
jgi:SchA/CurD like domain